MPTWFIWLVQPTRRHSALGDLNPNDFERAAAKETSRAVRNAHRPGLAWMRGRFNESAFILITDYAMIVEFHG